MPPPPLPSKATETLLSHAEGLRRLARALTHREDEADDAVQSAYLAALTSAGPAPRTLGPWLRGVLRRVLLRRARADVRRRQREERTARGRSGADAPAADEAVARHEVRERALAAVRALPEPYRYAILLRYFEGLAPAAIAQRQGVPLETAKSWLKRGLARLRDALDGQHGGDRRRWSQALLPASGGASALDGAAAGTPLLLTGGALVKQLGIAVLVLAVLGCAAWFLAAPTVRPPHAAGGEAAAMTAVADPVAAARHPLLVGRGGAGARVVGTVHGAPQGDLPPPGEDLPDGARVVGRVLGPGRFPVARASVIAEAGGRRWGTRSESDGRFRLPLGARFTSWTPLLVRVVADREVGLARGLVGPASPLVTDVGSIRLERPERLVVRVLQSGQPFAGARLWLQGLDGVMEPPVVAEGASCSDGTWTVEGLTAGQYRVLAQRPEGGRASRLVSVGFRSEGACEVVLPEPRTLAVRVLDADTQAPVAGALLHVFELVEAPGCGARVMNYLPGLEALPTDAQGQTRLQGLGEEDRVQVCVLAPGYPPLTDERGLFGLAAGVRETVVRVRRLRQVTFALTDGPAGSPRDGTPLRVVPLPEMRGKVQPSSARLEGGRIVLEGVSRRGGGRSVAEAPDGRRALLTWGDANGGQAEGVPTRFEGQRWLDVTLRQADGAAAAGWYVGVVVDERGGLDQAELEGGLFASWHPLDEMGRARLGPLFSGVYDLRVLRRLDDGAEPGAHVARSDLRAGDQVVDAHLPVLRRLALRLRWPGAPRLPDVYTLVLGRERPPVEEHPETGMLVTQVPALRRPQEPPLALSVPGFQPAYVHLNDLAPDAGSDAPLDVTLEPGVIVEVVAWVRGAAYGGPGDAPLVLRAQEGGGWSLVDRDYERHVTTGRPDGSTEVRTWSVAAPPGRFLVLHQGTGAYAELRQEQALGTPAEVLLDLRRAGVCTGHVDLPGGTDPAGVVVRAELPDIVAFHAPAAARARVGPDGSFRIPVPGDRVVRLRAQHPNLAAWRPEGSVEVSEPRDGLRLSLDRPSAEASDAR